MFVYVISKEGKPLMPCCAVIARLLLKDGKAKVKQRTPFTIQLLYNSTEFVQPVIAGMDTGSTKVGCAATANGKVIYQSEIFLRQNVSKKMKQRASYRRTRRNRKCRYRKPRWLNRANSKREGRLPPSIRSKIESHLRERNFVESILPISCWIVETASFDIHKITNSDVEGVGYQEGKQKGYYNTKAYVLNRDKYKCQSRQKIKHSEKLHVHHIKFRSNGGTNTPCNLITLCEFCHNNLHQNRFELTTKHSKTKHATEISIVKSQLKQVWDFEETFGYETKFKREHVLQLTKTHYHDAVAICCKGDETVKPYNNVFFKRHVASGDYQQTKGIRSQQKIPTGKLFGLRKFDLIQTPNCRGFIKGKRSTGYFSLMDINNKIISASVNVKKHTKRLATRTTTLTQLIGDNALSIPYLKEGVSRAK